jgi:hypothetical protein
MKKIKPLMLVVFIFALSIILFVIPPLQKSKINKSGPELLRLNGFKVEKVIDDGYFFSSETFIVSKGSKIDTVRVVSSKGVLSIQPKW